MALQTLEMEKLLGVPKGHHGSLLALADTVQAGVPFASVDRLAERVSPHDPQFRYRLVPRSTYERRKRTRRLSEAEGNRLARLAKVYAMAVTVFGDEETARQFLTRAHPMLRHRLPLDVALENGPGADAVILLLGRAANGSAV